MTINKALTLRASSIGDALMGKYFLENIHAFAPDARCYMLVGSRLGMIGELFHGYSWLTVVEANRKSRASLWNAYETLHGSDLTLTQEAERPFSTPSKLFARIVTKRGGFYGFNDGWFGNSYIYDHVIPFEGELKSSGIIVEEQKALTAMGVPVSVKDFSLKFDADNRALERFGLTPKSYILMHLFAGSLGREISQKKRAGLVRALREKLPKNVAIVLTGGKGRERMLTDEAAKGLENTKSIAGETNMKEFINLIANASVVVGLNTGASHIACHIGVPTVVLSHLGGKRAWFGDAMYAGVPAVFCRDDAPDSGTPESVHPMTMELISDAAVVEEVLSRLK